MRLVLSIVVMSILLFGCTSSDKKVKVFIDDSEISAAQSSKDPKPYQNLTESQTAKIKQNTTQNYSNLSSSNQSPASKNISSSYSNGSSKVDGMPFGDGKYLLVLDDVSISPESSPPCGIFSVRYANSYAKADRFIICSNTQKGWVAPDGKYYIFKIGSIAAGYSKPGIADANVSIPN